MKFIYVDETGSKSEGDVFVMTGLLVDAVFRAARLPPNIVLDQNCIYPVC